MSFDDDVEFELPNTCPVCEEALDFSHYFYHSGSHDGSTVISISSSTSRNNSSPLAAIELECDHFMCRSCARGHSRGGVVTCAVCWSETKLRRGPKRVSVLSRSKMFSQDTATPQVQQAQSASGMSTPVVPRSPTRQRDTPATSLNTSGAVNTSVGSNDVPKFSSKPPRAPTPRAATPRSDKKRKTQTPTNEKPPKKENEVKPKPSPRRHQEPAVQDPIPTDPLTETQVYPNSGSNSRDEHSQGPPTAAAPARRSLPSTPRGGGEDCTQTPGASSIAPEDEGPHHPHVDDSPIRVVAAFQNLPMSTHEDGGGRSVDQIVPQQQEDSPCPPQQRVSGSSSPHHPEVVPDSEEPYTLAELQGEEVERRGGSEARSSTSPRRSASEERYSIREQLADRVARLRAERRHQLVVEMKARAEARSQPKYLHPTNAGGVMNTSDGSIGSVGSHKSNGSWCSSGGKGKGQGDRLKLAQLSQQSYKHYEADRPHWQMPPPDAVTKGSTPPRDPAAATVSSLVSQLNTSSGSHGSSHSPQKCTVQPQPYIPEQSMRPASSTTSTQPAPTVNRSPPGVATSTQQCEKCGTTPFRAAQLQRCEDCEVLLCPSCDQAHHSGRWSTHLRLALGPSQQQPLATAAPTRYGATSTVISSVLSPPSDITQSPQDTAGHSDSQTPRLPRCTKPGHGQHGLELYCLEEGVTLCQLCAVQGARHFAGKSVLSIEDAVNVVKERQEHWLQQQHSKATVLQSDLADVDKELDKVQREGLEDHDEARAHFDALRRSVAELEKETLGRLEETSQSRLDGLMQRRALIQEGRELMLQEAQNVSSVLDLVRGATTPADLETQMRVLYIKKPQEHESIPKVAPGPRVQVSVDPVKAARALAACVSLSAHGHRLTGLGSGVGSTKRPLGKASAPPTQFKRTDHMASATTRTPVTPGPTAFVAQRLDYQHSREKQPLAYPRQAGGSRHNTSAGSVGSTGAKSSGSSTAGRKQRSDFTNHSGQPHHHLQYGQAPAAMPVSRHILRSAQHNLSSTSLSTNTSAGGGKVRSGSASSVTARSNRSRSGGGEHKPEGRSTSQHSQRSTTSSQEKPRWSGSTKAAHNYYGVGGY